jgi:drug/metabolite transporter (DMT)-like permease
MSTQTYPIILNLVAALIGAFGQYAYKIGGTKLGKIPLYQNWELLTGMILFCGVMVMFVIAFKNGGRISVTYPMYATTFIWGTLLGVLIDKEVFNIMQSIGVLLVVAGVSMVAYFAPKVP